MANIRMTDWETLIENGKYYELILQLLNDYEKLGPLPGLFLPFIEAFLPFLPLVVFVMANGAAYGLFKGFLYSWLGSSFGSIFVFIIIRRLGDRRIFKKISNNKQVNKVTTWVERHGFGPLFLMLCFPFSPSSLINVVAGLSKVSTQQFVLAVFLGKSVMIFSIAYVGSSILEFAKNPLKTIVICLGIVLFWMIGKLLERNVQKRIYKKSYPNRD